MKRNNRELIKKTAIITVGNMSTKLISFFLLPFYTYVLTTEEYGTYDLLHTYIYLLIPILGFQLDQAVFKFLVENRTDNDNQKSLVTTTTLFMAFQLIVYALIFFVIGMFYYNQYLPYLAVMVICTMVQYDTQQMVRGINKTTLYAAAGVMSSSLAIISNIILLTIFHLGIKGLFLSGILASIITTCFLWLTSGLSHYLDLHSFSKYILKKELSFGLPLVPNELAWWLIHASDRTIVSALLGVAQNGIIAVSQKFSSAYITVYNIFNLSWTESVILHFKDNDGEEYISNTIETVIELFFSAAIGIVAVMPFVFPFFINLKYGQAYYLIPLYMIAGIIDVCLGLISAVFVAESKTKYVATTTIIAGLINICTHIGLISFVGIYAAPISTILGYGSILAMRYRKILKDTRIVVKSRKLVAMTFIMTTTLIVYYCRISWICGVCLVADAIVLLYMNRQIISGLLDMVRKKRST